MMNSLRLRRLCDELPTLGAIQAKADRRREWTEQVRNQYRIDLEGSLGHGGCQSPLSRASTDAACRGRGEDRALIISAIRAQGRLSQLSANNGHHESVH
jgi:hypothetical protein